MPLVRSVASAGVLYSPTSSIWEGGEWYKAVKDGKQKISLSMKVVHQGTGKDLDANNVVLEQDERKRREFRDYSKQKITLEAVLNTVCKKCGCKGHFAKDCFMQPGGTKYSLVPEEEEDDKDADKKTEKHVKKRKKIYIIITRKRKEKCIEKKRRNLQEQRVHQAAFLKVPTQSLPGRRDVMQKRVKRPQRKRRKSTRNTNKGTE
ncbi:zinc finger CCHC domain-containing protein 17 isoform X3 [Anomaloglossus baeobatrachus]|uniref:zinc finger CCHC domain-containing protein 17 isoform X3 n=1 Tax=Anomaloglossus baeobatrachus TaxID=238106 RepID=UPI003F506590